MVTIESTTQGGGSVSLNKREGVWASYRVSDVIGQSLPLLYAGAGLKDGRYLQFFFNRDTNLVVVDVLDKNGEGGIEILRQKV